MSLYSLWFKFFREGHQLLIFISKGYFFLGHSLFSLRPGSDHLVKDWSVSEMCVWVKMMSNIKLLKIVGEVKKENPISKYCFLLENFPIKWSPFTEHWKWYFRSSLGKGYIVLFTWTSHKRRNWINTEFTSFIFSPWSWINNKC